MTVSIFVWYAAPPPAGNTEKVNSILSVARASKGTLTEYCTLTDLPEPCRLFTVTVDWSNCTPQPDGGADTDIRKLS